VRRDTIAAVSRRPLSLPRRIVFSLVTALGLLVAVEVGLRVASGFVGGAALPVESGDGLRISAFGDSYTFGIGADEPRREGYPRVAADLLEAAGRTVRLRNHAQPGLNSTRVVAALESALPRDRPHVVLLLAGVNNTRWLGQSGRFCLDEGTPPPPDLVRDLRLYKVLRHAVLAERPPRPADVACRAVAEGFQSLDDGLPDVAEESFALAREVFPASRWAQLGSALATARTGDFPVAVQRFEAAADLARASPALPLAHAFALRSAGRTEDARAVLAGVGRDGDLDEVVLLLEGLLLHDEGRHADAEAALVAVARGTPGRPAGGGVVPFALDGVGWTRLARGDAEGARAAFLEAHAVGDAMHVTPHLLGWSHVGLALLDLAAGAPPGDVRASLERAKRDTTTGRTVPDVEALVSAGRPVSLEELASRFRSTPTPAVQQWFDPGDTSLLTSDLTRAVASAREAGAVPILLTYPQPAAHDEIAAAVLRVGREMGVTVVDPRDRFRSEHDAGRPWAELLMPDGHPTAAGYALIGEMVAAAIDAQGSEGSGAGW